MRRIEMLVIHLLFYLYMIGIKTLVTYNMKNVGISNYVSAIQKKHKRTILFFSGNIKPKEIN